MRNRKAGTSTDRPFAGNHHGRRDCIRIRSYQASIIKTRSIVEIWIPVFKGFWGIQQDCVLPFFEQLRVAPPLHGTICGRRARVGGEAWPRDAVYMSRIRVTNPVGQLKSLV